MSDYQTAKPVPSVAMYKAPAGYKLMDQKDVSSYLGRISQILLSRAVNEQWPMPSDLYFEYDGHKFIAQLQWHGPNQKNPKKHPGISLYEWVGATDQKSLLERQTPKIKTRTSEIEILQSIKNVWDSVFGQNPTLQQVLTAYGQLAMETGHGNDCYNYNVGNINWTSGFPGKFYFTKDSTSKNGNPAVRDWYDAKMRSYNSLDDGVKDYLRWIKTHKGASTAVMSGDPKAFSRALATAGYYDPHMRDDFVNDKGQKVQGNTSGSVGIFNGLMKKHEAGKLDLDAPSQSSSGGEGFLASLFDAFVNKLKSVFASGEIIGIECRGEADMATKVEFASILKQALKEEAKIVAAIADDGLLAVQSGDNEEVIAGVLLGVSDAFALATTKIGTIIIDPHITAMSTSANEMELEDIEKRRRRFRMKFRGRS